MFYTTFNSFMSILPNWLESVAALPAVQISLEFVPHILCAMLLGGIIGYERRTRHKQAGVRTHMVMASAACVLALCGLYASKQSTGIDPTRLCAQLFSAMGFLGLVIWHKGEHASGITTVGTLLLSAALGIACGYGFFGLAAGTTLLVLAALSISYRFFPSLEMEGHTVSVTCPTAKFKETLSVLGSGAMLDEVTSTTPERLQFRAHTNMSPSQLNDLLVRLAETPNNDISISDCSK